MRHNQIRPRKPGWYPDPHARQLRYWDGTEWTELVSPKKTPLTAVLAFLMSGERPEDRV